MKRLLALGICLFVGVVAQAQNWPTFRGPNSTGVADGEPIPQHWNVENGENILWKTPIPGFGHSSPIVWGDKVFVTTAATDDPEYNVNKQAQTLTVNDDVEFSFKLYALDKRTGEVRWERTAYKGLPKSQRHPQSSHASPTPVTNGEIVLAYFGSVGLFAYDLEGNLLWKKDLGQINVALFLDLDMVYGVGTTPVIYKDLVIIQADKDKDSFIAAYRLQDGKEVWRQARDEFPSWSTPVLYTEGERDELITQAFKFTRSYDPATGKELWRFGKNGEQHIPSPILSDGLVYFTSNGNEVSPIYAIRPGASGDISIKEGQPKSEHIVWHRKRGGVHIVSPLVYRGHVYVVSDNGILGAYDADTGKRVFRARLGGRGGSFFASPIGVNGHIYFASQEGDVFIIKAGPQYELVAENTMDEMIMATPAISDGVIYVRGLKNLYAIGKSSAATGGDLTSAKD